MDKKSKILIGVFVALIIASVGVTYWRIMIQKDYIVEAQTDCDPYTDVCFIWECDPESDVEGEACTGDPELDSWYFQVIGRKAYNIPLCDPGADETCEALICPEGEADCTYEFCTEETMEEQYAVACNDPVKFSEENPIEDENAACDLEADADCLPPEEETCDSEVDESCAVEEEGEGACCAAEGEGEAAEGDAAEAEGTEAAAPATEG